MVFGLFNILERVIPFTAVLVSCFVSYSLLTGQRRAELEELDVRCNQTKIDWWERFFCKKRAIDNLNKAPSRQPTNKLKGRATYTILLGTMNYTMLNLPNVLYMILAFSDLFREGDDPSLLSFDTNNYFVTFSLVMCAGLHALITPLIWFWRMDDLRKFYKKLLFKAAGPLGFFKDQRVLRLPSDYQHGDQWYGNQRISKYPMKI
jgi:hypothetical protein